MAKIGYRHTTIGSNLYFVITDEANKHMRSFDYTFVVYVALDWIDYTLIATETDDYLYEYMLPNMVDGTYIAEVFLQTGSLPLLTDDKLGQSSFNIKDNDFFNLTDASVDVSNIGSW